MEQISTKEFSLDVLQAILLSRLLDEKMNKLIRQNKGGTFFLSNQGHELIGSVCALSLDKGKDWFLPYYRDRACPIALGATAKEILQTSLAKEGKNHSGGRMMPEHFSDKAKRIICQSSVVGSQYLQAVGIAKSIQLKNKDEIVYVSGGDGSTSQGDFHEALNFSAIHKLPIIFVVQDNSWAISVPLEEQTAGGDISLSIQGIPGLKVFSINGNDFEQCYKAMDQAKEHIRSKQEPVVIHAKVSRLGAHSNSDDPRKYQQPTQLVDPVQNYIQYLVDKKICSQEQIDQLQKEIAASIEEAAIDADQTPCQDPSLADSLVFKPFDLPQLKQIDHSEKEDIVIVDAINHAIDEEMSRDESIVVFGQDVAHGKGGVFGVTKNLTERYGSHRCFNTPLAESTIIGIATGMSMAYHRPIAEIQFADYIWTGVNQLFNELASICYRSNGQWNCPVVIRMPCGGYIQGGPYHSQNIEAYLAHTPGLKVVLPSRASDAKKLLKAAIYDPNPVIFLEHKGLYRQRSFSATKEPFDHELLEFGRADVPVVGNDLTMITYGMMTVFAVDIAKQLAKENIHIEVIDLRTINPLDKNTILHSVKKTGKVLIVHEAAKTCGFGAELAAFIIENAFEFLDAPIRRIGAKDCPVPYCKQLEDAVLPQKQQILRAAKELASF